MVDMVDTMTIRLSRVCGMNSITETRWKLFLRKPPVYYLSPPSQNFSSPISALTSDLPCSLTWEDCIDQGASPLTLPPTTSFFPSGGVSVWV